MKIFKIVFYNAIAYKFDKFACSKAFEPKASIIIFKYFGENFAKIQKFFENYPHNFRTIKNFEKT